MSSGWGQWRVLLVGAVVGVLTPVRVYPDSISYMFVDLTTMPDAYLVCGATLAPSLPASLLEPLTTYALRQLVLARTMLPCLPAAYFLADGNSRYGLPVLAMSLVVTVGMVERALGRVRRPRPAATSDQPREAGSVLAPQTTTATRSPGAGT